MDGTVEASNVTDSGEARTGPVLYEIPGTMRLQEESKCLVRIAYEEAVIVEDIMLTENTVIKDIRISDVMQVELMDTNPNAPFSIRTISRKEQFIDSDKFTEWIFFVKPLKEGKYPLTIKVAVIEMIHGREAYREVVLEEEIEIVTEQVNTDVAVAPKSVGYSFGAPVGMVQPTLDSREISSLPTADIIPPPIQQTQQTQTVQPTPPPAARKSRAWVKPTALAMALLIGVNAVTYAAAPADYEWNATRYLFNSENAYENYIERWEADNRNHHVEDAYFQKAEVSQKTAAFVEYLDKYHFQAESEKSSENVGKYTERAMFSLAKLTKDPKWYEQYILEFPDGKYSEDAHFELAKITDTPKSYQKYLDKFPNGKRSGEIRARLKNRKGKLLENVDNEKDPENLRALEKLFTNREDKEKVVFSITKLEPSGVSFLKYREGYPKGKYIEEVNTSIKEQKENLIERAKTNKDLDELKALVKLYPDEVESRGVRKLIEQLQNRGDNTEDEAAPRDDQSTTSTDEAQKEEEAPTDQTATDKDGKFKDKIEEIKNEVTGTPKDLDPFINPATGNNYKTVVLKDGKTWLAENLNLKTTLSACYNDEENNCMTYGRLYNQIDAKEACKRLGEGWRLPTDQDWQSMTASYTTPNMAITQRGKAVYLALLGNSQVGFMAKLGGYSTITGKSKLLGNTGYYWSSTKQGVVEGWMYYFKGQSKEFFRYNVNVGTKASCRCVKD